MVMNDASKCHILCPAQSHTAGQGGGRAQPPPPPPLLAPTQQIARCGGRLAAYYTFWRVSGAGSSISYPASTHMMPGEQGRRANVTSGVLKQAGGLAAAGERARQESIDQKHEASKGLLRSASFLLVNVRDLRFSSRATRQGNVGRLGAQNGIFRLARACTKTPDSS